MSAVLRNQGSINLSKQKKGEEILPFIYARKNFFDIVKSTFLIYTFSFFFFLLFARINFQRSNEIKYSCEERGATRPLRSVFEVRLNRVKTNLFRINDKRCYHFTFAINICGAIIKSRDNTRRRILLQFSFLI